MEDSFVNCRYHHNIMEQLVIRVSEAETERGFAALLAPVTARRSRSECIKLSPKDSKATIDPDFAKDVAVAIERHREALEPPLWD